MYTASLVELGAYLMDVEKQLAGNVAKMPNPCLFYLALPVFC